MLRGNVPVPEAAEGLTSMEQSCFVRPLTGCIIEYRRVSSFYKPYPHIFLTWSDYCNDT